MYSENQLTDIIIDKAIEIHRRLGPGLLESVYQECLFYELLEESLDVKREVTMPITYKEVKINHGYRLDLLVKDKVVVEIKSVGNLNEVHKAQLLTYLKLGDYRVGLLINFHVKILKNGIKRIVNHYQYT